MKKSNRLISTVMLLVTLLTSVSFVSAESPVIEIHTPEELIAFAESSHYDLFSKGKVVRLMNDLDLSDYRFQGIASFSGIFEGNRHTISGINIDVSGSNQGLFRYLEKGGIIRNLTVEGRVDPVGSKEEIGGIVANNRGLIINCTFRGDVSGKSSVGGIVGFNETTGRVMSSKVYGSVVGEHLTGGLVGNNEGLIQGSTNHSMVNTTDETLSNADENYKLDSLKKEEIKSAETIESQTDTGGIAGFNKGILLDNSNYGMVGYKHVGYNIGGIVGRQSGYIKGCKNYGQVYGRKDVGGIVGQFEPYIRLLFSEDTLRKLDQEFKTMNELLEVTVVDANQSNNTILSDFEEVNQLMSQASSDLETVLNKTTDFTDDAAVTVNEGFTRLQTISKQLVYVVDELQLANGEITKSFADLKLAFDELSNTSQAIDDGIDDVQDAFYQLELASQDADKAMTKISIGLKQIQTATKPSSQYTQGVKSVEAGFSDLEKSVTALNSSLKIITDYYNENTTLIGINLGEIMTNLESAQSGLSTAMPNLKQGFSLLSQELEDDLTLINEAMVFFEAASKDFKAMSEDLDDARRDLDESLKDFEKGSKAATKAMDYMSDSMEKFKSASDHTNQSITYMTMILDEQNRKPALKFPTLSDYVKEDSESLFDTLSEMTLALSQLNSSARHGSTELVDNLKLINQQYKVIAELIGDGLSSLSYDNQALFEDVSDTSIDSEDDSLLTSGYLSGCYNEGDITGDVDVGGIAGAMAIEYDFDPEDDIVKKGNNTFNFKYQTKAVLKNSVNKGIIESKKNYVGGIVGRMDLGLLTRSENYSSVISSDGHYVGGIVGFSDAVIRSVYSKSELSGKNFIGGIAGSANDIQTSFALVNIIESNECVGAIAGQTRGDLSQNKFVLTNWHGVDGISYDAQTQPLNFEAFMSYDLPDGFDSFELTYKVEGEIIDKIPFNYGESLEENRIPPIANREGYYSEWPYYDYENLVFSHTFEAVYTPLIEVLSSDETIKPQLLVEGVFDPDIKLRMNPTNSYKPKVGESFIKEWRVALDHTATEAYKYRYLKPETDDSVKFYQNIEGRWVSVDTTEDGSYITFESAHNNFNLAVVSVKETMMVYYIIASIMILLFATLVFKKRWTKKRTA